MWHPLIYVFMKCVLCYTVNNGAVCSMLRDYSMYVCMRVCVCVCVYVCETNCVCEFEACEKGTV